MLITPPRNSRRKAKSNPLVLGEEQVIIVRLGLKDSARQKVRAYKTGRHANGTVFEAGTGVQFKDGTVAAVVLLMHRSWRKQQRMVVGVVSGGDRFVVNQSQVTGNTLDITSEDVKLAKSSYTEMWTSKEYTHAFVVQNRTAVTPKDHVGRETRTKYEYIRIRGLETKKAIVSYSGLKRHISRGYLLGDDEINMEGWDKPKTLAEHFPEFTFQTDTTNEKLKTTHAGRDSSNRSKRNRKPPPKRKVVRPTRPDKGYKGKAKRGNDKQPEMITVLQYDIDGCNEREWTEQYDAIPEKIRNGEIRTTDYVHKEGWPEFREVAEVFKKVCREIQRLKDKAANDEKVKAKALAKKRALDLHKKRVEADEARKAANARAKEEEAKRQQQKAKREQEEAKSQERTKMTMDDENVEGGIEQWEWTQGEDRHHQGSPPDRTDDKVIYTAHRSSDGKHVSGVQHDQRERDRRRQRNEQEDMHMG